MTTGEYGDSGRPSAIKAAVMAVLSDAGEFRSTTDGASTVFATDAKFAELVELRKWADLTFFLPGPLESSRVRDLALNIQRGWAHTVRLYTVEDVDEEVALWLAQALEQGSSGHLTEVFDGLPSDQLHRFSASFESMVVKIRADLYIELPDVVRTALGAATSVDVRMSGIYYDTRVRYFDDGAYIPVDDITGLREGDSTDVFLKVRV